MAGYEEARSPAGAATWEWRFLRQRGSVLAEVSVLDRLAFLGTRTMGALTYHPPSDPADHEAQLLDLHEMATASEEVLAGTVPEVLPQLLRAGGSPGGEHSTTVADEGRAPGRT